VKEKKHCQNEVLKKIIWCRPIQVVKVVFATTCHVVQLSIKDVCKHGCTIKCICKIWFDFKVLHVYFLAYFSYVVIP
jgi:hypothetical protein